MCHVLNENSFPQKLSGVTKLEVGFMRSSSLHAGIFTGLISFRSYAGSHNCCDFMSVLVLSRRYWSAAVLPTSGYFDLSIPPSVTVFDFGVGCDNDVPHIVC